MITWKNWHRFVAIALFVCTLALAGCGKKDDTPKAEGGTPTPADPKEKKKDGDITPDDLRAAVKAAGGDPDKPKQSPKTAESLKDAKPDVVLTAKQFVEEFTKNMHFLFTKYDGKVVEVSGIVDDYREDAPGKASLNVRGGDKKGADLIQFPVQEKSIATKVLPSQTVVLRIRGSRETARLGVAPWELIEAKGTLPTLTAVQFARAQATKPDELKKYAEQEVIVTGALVSAETEDKGTRLFLRGEGEATVSCWFPGKPLDRIPLTQKQKDGLKPGQMVKVVGRYQSATGGLLDCILLEPAP